jgi:hypothetical protein
MSDDDFWAGMLLGGTAAFVGIVMAQKFGNESYARGWNGEQLVNTFALGLLGQTNTGATVWVASFKNGEHDREVRLALNMQNRELQLVNKQVSQVSEELKRLQVTVQKVAQPALPTEKRQFLDDLYTIAHSGVLKKKETRQSPSYSV